MKHFIHLVKRQDCFLGGYDLQEKMHFLKMYVKIEFPLLLQMVQGCFDLETKCSLGWSDVLMDLYHDGEWEVFLENIKFKMILKIFNIKLKIIKNIIMIKMIYISMYVHKNSNISKIDQ